MLGRAATLELVELALGDGASVEQRLRGDDLFGGRCSRHFQDVPQMGGSRVRVLDNRLLPTIAMWHQRWKGAAI